MSKKSKNKTDKNSNTEYINFSPNTSKSGVSTDAKVALACSGGPDSLALLILLQKSGYDVQPLYVDHKTKQSKKFWKAVVKACKKLEISKEPIRLEIDKELPKANFEEAARKARYRALDGWLKENEFDFIALAHTIDDQAETVIFNFIRGGVEGLGGMSEITKHYWRPMLFQIRKDQTSTICDTEKVKYVQDKANKNEKYSRVQIRKNLIPLMDQIMNRDVSPIIARNSRLIKSENAFLNNLAKKSWPGGSEPLAKNLAELNQVVALRAIRIWIGHPRIRSRDAKRVLAVARGKAKAVQLEGKIRVWRSKGVMHYEKS